jgi:hypothetical protein
MKQEKAGYWCACGHYCGGLAYAADVAKDARERHDLHLVQLHNIERLTD